MIDGRAIRWLAPLATVLLFSLGPEGASGQGEPSAPAALSKLQSQDFGGAAEVLERLIESQAENGCAWSLLGFAYRSLERVDEAVAAYENAVSLPGSGGSAAFNLGLTLLLDGQADRGYEWLRKARDGGSVDVTQIDLHPKASELRDDPRYATLFPTPEQFADPFVEPVRIIHEWRGESVNDQFGWIARDIGDVNGDGVHDVIAGAPGSDKVHPTCSEVP